jgi:flagellar biosynthesis/type III secretory pathway protein FliH
MTDGPKRMGRFLKKGTSVFEKISLVDFSFQDIKAPKGLTPDNATRTIIHVEHHDQESLDQALKEHTKFDLDLISPEDRQRVIMPRDFTADWERDRSMRKRKVARFDDDDFEMELDSLKRNKSPVQLFTDLPTDLPPTKENPEPLLKPTVPLAPNGEPQGQKRDTWQTMNEVGKAINELHSKEAVKEQPIQSMVRSSIPEASNFTQVSPEQEVAALAQYQRQQQELAKMKAEFQEELENILESEKAKAYREGFSLGEEKAELQTRGKSAELLKNITQIVGELSQLKFLILSNVQENFYTICQAIGEALVKREFSIHPETFAEVLRRALAESVQPNNVKILVHPEMHAKLLSLNIPDLRDILQKDDQIPEAGFKLESHLSVIDGNISEMISKMLKQADLGIFDNADHPQNERKIA